MLKKIETKKHKRILGYRGIDLNRPYTQDDIFLEPTQKRLEEDSRKYVPFLDYQNKLLDSLYQISVSSPTLSGILQTKKEYVTLGGFEAIPSAKRAFLPNLRDSEAEVDPEAIRPINDWMHKVNEQGQTLIDVAQDISDNLSRFGNCFLEVYVISNKLYLRVKSIYLCRPEKAPKGKMYGEKIGVSIEWQEIATDNYNVVEYPKFPNFERIDGALRSILHIKIDSPNFYYWGAPEWLGAKIWGEIEYRIAKFNQAKFENGFTPSALVTLYGLGDDEEAQEMVDDIVDCFTNTGNNNKMFIQALRDTEAKVDVQILEGNNEGEFLAQAVLCREQLISATGWSVALLGQAVSGSLGGNQQLINEYEKAYSGSIRPNQKRVMQPLNRIFKWAKNKGIEGFERADEVYIDLCKGSPLSLASQIDPTLVTTINEQREEIGKKYLEGQDKFLTDGNTNANPA